MQSDRHTLRWIIISSLISFSFLVLAFTKAIDWLFFENTRQMMQHPFWSTIVYAFSFLFFIALMVFVPIQILYFGRKERSDRPLQKMTVADVIGLPFGASNPDAEVPKWIKIPVLSVMYILSAILLLGLLMGLIAFLFKRAG